MQKVTISLTKVECEKCGHFFYAVDSKNIAVCPNCVSESLKKTTENLELSAIKKLNMTQCEHCEQSIYSFYDKNRVCCCCNGNSLAFLPCDVDRAVLENCIDDTFKKWVQKSPDCKKSANVIRKSVRENTFNSRLRDNALLTLWHIKEMTEY